MLTEVQCSTVGWCVDDRLRHRVEKERVERNDGLALSKCAPKFMLMVSRGRLSGGQEGQKGIKGGASMMASVPLSEEAQL